MTQPHLIEQAKQGDPQAIAALMNKSLQEKGMVAYVDRLGTTLEVVLEAERVPNRQALTAFVEKGIQNLEIESIKSIKVSGKQFGSDLPAWTHDLYLETPTPEFEPDLFMEDEPDFSTSSFESFSAESFSAESEQADDFSTALDQSSDQFLDQPLDGDIDLSVLDDALADDFLSTGQSGFEEDATSLFGEGQFSQDEPISDLSQLQDLLSEESNTSTEPHRQEVEDRLESLWAETSEEESQDFLSELLADDSAETAMPLEGFLDEPATSPATDLEAGDLQNLWGQPDEPTEQASEEDFLNELMGDEPVASSQDFSQDDPLAEESNFWLEDTNTQGSLSDNSSPGNTSLDDIFRDNTTLDDMSLDSSPDDEPDEVLLSFLDDTPTPPAIPTGDDEFSDEPDEILLGFLEEEPHPQSSSNLETGDLSSLPDFPIAEESAVSPEEEALTSPDWNLQQEWVELPIDESGIEEQPPVAAEDQWQNALSDANTDAPDKSAPPLDWLAESSEFNQPQQPLADDPDRFLEDLSFEQPEEQSAETSADFSLDWQDETSEPLHNAPVSEFIDTSPDALTTPLESQPSDLDLESLGFLSTSNDEEDEFVETEPWEEPPIELLQDDLEPPAPDMPTEQYDEPLIEFFAESSEEPQANTAGEFGTGQSADQFGTDQFGTGQSADQFGTDQFDSDQFGANQFATDQFGSDQSNAEQNSLLDEFPEDFLQEPDPLTQQPDLAVEPGSNPFLEQFGEPGDPPLGLNYSPEADTNIAAQEFNALDWQPVEDESSDPDLPQFSPEAIDSTNPPTDDAALGNFFEDEPPANAAVNEHPLLDLESLNADATDTNARSPLDLESLNTDWQFENSYDATTEGFDRPTSADAFEPDFEPEADWQSNPIQDNSVENNSVGNNLTPPDGTPVVAAGFASDHPDYEEPSQEALEEQLARFDMEATSSQEPIANSTTATATEPRSPWLFPLILLGISGWIVGLISFAFLWSKLSSPPTSPESTAVSSPAPGTVAPAAAPTLACTPAAPTTSSRGIDLTSIQFQPNTANPQQVNVVGCLTNRTQQPIDLVSVAYRAGRAASPAIGGLSFADRVIQPGQTIAFTSKFTLPSETTNVAIETLYWQQAGAKTSQEAKTSIVLNR